MNLNDLIEKEGERILDLEEIRLGKHIPNKFICGKSETEKLFLFRHDELNSLEGIEKFKKIKKIEWAGNFSVNDFSYFRSNNLFDTVKTLNMYGTWIYDISFLSNYRVLEELDLGGSKDIFDFSVLSSNHLAKNLKKLGLKGAKISDISFLRRYKNLSDLDLSDCKKVSDFSPLNFKILASNIKKLDLARSNVSDLSFLSGYKVLENLNIGMCDNISDFSILNFFTLAKSIKNLDLARSNVSDLSFLSDYRVLENLDLSLCRNISDFSVLDSVRLANSIKNLDLARSNVSDLSFLSDYKVLEKIEIMGCVDISNFSGLSSYYLGKSITSLNLDDTNFFDLPLLKNYSKLSDLALRHTNVRDIGDILSHEYVRNGSLKKIYLSDSIDWTLVRDGKYINTEAVRELKRRGVEVIILSERNIYMPKILSKDVLYSAITYLGLDDKISEVVSDKLDAAARAFIDGKISSNFIKEFDQGRVAKKVVDIGGLIYKITSPELLIREHSIYSADLGEFDNYKPNLKLEERVYNDEFGILVVENVSGKKGLFDKSRASRFLSEKKHLSFDYDIERNGVIRSLDKKSISLIKNSKGEVVMIKDLMKESGANSLYDFIDHFMYVAGLFHSNDVVSLALGGIRHGASKGYDYIEELKNIPSRDFSNLLKAEGFKPRDYASRLDQSSALIEESACCPLIGDFKLNNTVNGYVLDFDRARFGNPGEDVVKFLEQAELGLSKEEKAHFMDRYIIHRMFYDVKFTKDQAERLKKDYGNYAVYENLRTLRANCTWQQNLNGSYNKNKISGIINNLKAL